MLTLPEARLQGRAPAASRRRFVLVTGMPRSGTTAVGSVLASGNRSAYFYEPLNPRSGLRSVDDYFVFPPPDGQHVRAAAQLGSVLEQVFKIDIRLKPGRWDADSGLRRALKTVTGSRTRVSGIRCRLDPTLRTVVWKDPFAAFLVPLLVAEYRLPTVVTVRSPEASAASFKRLGWGFDVVRIHRELARLLPQAPFLAPDLDLEACRADPVLNAAVLWRLTYGFLVATAPPQVHDDGAGVTWASGRRLIAAPEHSYEEIFDAVGLPFEERSHRFIAAEHRDEGSARPSSARAHDRHRNVNQANSYWTDTLSSQEKDAVRVITADVREQLEGRIGPL